MSYKKTLRQHKPVFKEDTHTFVTTHYIHQSSHISFSRSKQICENLNTSPICLWGKPKHHSRSHSHKTQSIMTWTLTSRNTSHLLSGRWTIWQQHEGQKVARYIKQTLRPSRNTCQPAALALDRNKALCSWPELTANQISHSQINIHDPRVAGKPGTTGYYDWIRVTKN